MRARSIQIIFSSSIGTILEWYDFSLFAFLTPILATLFFPQENKFTSLMLTYAIFAIGFFIRPLGAFIFGHLGDRIGRKKTLIISILLMAISTFFIGLLPTYNQIGMWAPILLIALRLCQGLSVGGETTGAILFAIEAGQYQRRGFVTGLLWSFVGIGMLLGSYAATLVTASTTSYAWRIPFLLGILTGLIGYFVRKRIPESAAFQQMISDKTILKFPLYHGITKYKIALLRIIGLFILSAMITYLIFVFMASYAANVIGLPLAPVTLITTFALTAVTLLVPLGGYLSDIVGRKKILQWSVFGMLVCSYPLFFYISLGSIDRLIIAESIFVILAACYQGTLNAFVIEQVPIEVRYSIMAVGYNIAYSLFGGTAPLIAGYLVRVTGNHAAPGFYLMFGAIIALMALHKVNNY